MKTIYDGTEFEYRMSAFCDKVSQYTSGYSLAIYAEYPHCEARAAIARLSEALLGEDKILAYSLIPWAESTLINWFIEREVDRILILRQGDDYEPAYDLPPHLEHKLHEGLRRIRRSDGSPILPEYLRSEVAS
jgi:hypothetical protein